MFEKISGFFKRFSRRGKRQSGETTIIDGQEPGIDEFGLDEGLGEPGEPDISTGGSDFDDQTISDEISGSGPGVAELEEIAEGFPVEAEEPLLGEPIGEPEPGSPAKRILTVAVIAVILGGVIQLFLWPVAGKMLGLLEPEEPELPLETLIGSEERSNRDLKGEMVKFEGIGTPAEVKALLQQRAQARDSQGSMEEFENTYSLAKEKEAAYDELLAGISEIESEISKTRADISRVEVQTEAARLKVLALARQMEEEYERFQLELVRAELSQRLLIELQMENIESFRAELAELVEYLSQLTPVGSSTISSEDAHTSEALAKDLPGG
ncbi:MAG: hypothetical protein JSV16_01290 [Candidatus Hydrogenedentota bacterium]|nr:MAG: hypothetical protein JSV16_01290 [Candidatus Hydrogenedentota bacterium]